MTDQECLLQLIASLGLKKEETNGQPSEHGYQIDTNVEGKTAISIGSGKGYMGFSGSFVFDSNGKALEHGVWE